MLRRLYTAFFILFSPAIFIYLLFINRPPNHYGRKWKELWSIYRSPGLTACIWLHAASLGEAILAAKLIEPLRNTYPDLPLVVTTIRPTGRNYLAKQFGEAIVHLYLPFDIPCFVKRLIRHLQPKLLIILETELWPNLLAVTRQNHIPILLANARLSERASRRYTYIFPLMREMLSHISVIAAQSALDAERFKHFGADTDHLYPIGNIKFDMKISPGLAQESVVLRERWHLTMAWIAASTHEGEEAQLLQVHKQIKAVWPNCTLVLVPRYPERGQALLKLAQKEGFSAVLRTQADTPVLPVDVIIVDVLGELMLWYAAAKVAFVGGSLVKIGGHNLLEPAMLGLPIITGPHIFNSKAIHNLLSQTSALITITQAAELAQALMKLLESEILREEMGSRAKNTVVANQGALNQHMHFIQQLLSD